MTAFRESAARSPSNTFAIAALTLSFVAAFTAPGRADWQDGGGAAWAEVLAAAQKEGKVVVMGRPDLAKPFAESFQRDTGLKLEFLGGEGREQLSRLTRELRAGRVTIDVLFTGAGTVDLAHQGKLMELKPQLLLPGVTDPSNWFEGRFKWMDKTATYLPIPSEYIFGWPLINNTLVKAGALKTWQDLLKPEFKGKIAAFDPRTGGPGQAAASYLADLFGIDFIKKLYVGQDVTIAAHSRQMVEWLARGTHVVALGALPTDIEQFRKNGITNLEVGEMSDGPGTLLGGSAIISQPKGAPHPAAATVFINWYLSKPGQEVFARVWKVPSRRVDVAVPDAPAYVVPKPGRTYLDQYQEDWYQVVRPKVAKEIIEALGGH